MLSKEWVYDNIFKLSRGESDKQRETMIEDLKDRYRFRSIEDEGNEQLKKMRKLWMLKNLWKILKMS